MAEDTKKIQERYHSMGEDQQRSFLDTLRPDAGKYKEFIDIVYPIDDEFWAGYGQLDTPTRLSVLNKMTTLAPEKFDEIQEKGYIDQPSKWGKAIADTPGTKAINWWHEEINKPIAAGVTAPIHEEGWGKLKGLATVGGGALGAWAMGKYGGSGESYDKWNAPSVDTGLDMPFIGGDITLGVKGLSEIATDPLTIASGGGITRVGKAITSSTAKGSARHALGEGIAKTGGIIQKMENAPSAFVKTSGKALTGAYGKGALDLSDEAVKSMNYNVGLKELELKSAIEAGDSVAVERLATEIATGKASMDMVASFRKLTDELPAIRRAIKETEGMRTKERAERFAKIKEGVAGTEGRQSYINALKSMEGEMPSAHFEPLVNKMVDQDIDNIFTLIMHHPSMVGREAQQLTAGRGVTKILEGVVPQNSELAALRPLLGDKAIGTLLAKRGTWDRASDLALDLANFPRAVLASFDVSAPLRQGLFFQAGRPREAFGAYPAMFKALISEDRMVKTYSDIESGKWFGTADAYGVHSAPMPVKGQTASLNQYEEAYMTRMANKIPGIRQSQRAYSTYLTKLRHDVFSTVAENWEKQGIQATEKQYRDLARLVNVGTGRGRLPKNMEKHGAFLSTMLFSPRLQAARIELPTMWATLDPLVRKEYIRNGLSMLVAGTSILTIAELMGAEVEKNPTSSNFGKIKLGNTRFDIWGGNQQYARLLANLTTGYYTSGAGEKKDISRKDIIERFIKGKLSPGAGIGLEAWTGTTYMGDEFAPDAEYARQKLMPMVAQDVWDTWEESGAFMAGVAYPLASLGMGVQSYGKGTYSERNELREKHNHTGEDWADLDKHERDEIDNSDPYLKDLIEKLKTDYDSYTGSDEEKLIRQISDQKQEEFNAKMEGLAKAKLNTSSGVGWQQYNELRSEYMTERYAIGGMSREISAIYSDLTEEEIEDKIRNNLSTHDNILRDYKELLGNPIRNEYGIIDWDATWDKVDKFVDKQNSDNKAYIAEHKDDWVNNMSSNIQSVEQQRNQLIGILKPYWEVREQVLAGYPESHRKLYEEYQKIIDTTAHNNESLSQLGLGTTVNIVREIDGRMKGIRGQMRQQDPQLDYAVRVWY